MVPIIFQILEKTFENRGKLQKELFLIYRLSVTFEQSVQIEKIFTEKKITVKPIDDPFQS